MRPRRLRGTRPATPPALAPEGAAELAALHEVLRAVLGATDPAELFQSALDRVAPVLGASLAAVYLTDGEAELMRLVAAHRWPGRWRPWLGQVRVRVGFGPSGEAAAERRAIELPDLLAADGVEDWQEVARELGFRAMLAVPMLVGREVLGVVTFCFPDHARITPLGRPLARGAAEVLALGAERMRQREAVRRAEAALAEAREALERAEGREGVG